MYFHQYSKQLVMESSMHLFKNVKRKKHEG
jgi:hypothetical protein